MIIRSIVSAALTTAFLTSSVSSSQGATYKRAEFGTTVTENVKIVRIHNKTAVLHVKSRADGIGQYDVIGADIEIFLNDQVVYHWDLGDDHPDILAMGVGKVPFGDGANYGILQIVDTPAGTEVDVNFQDCWKHGCYLIRHRFQESGGRFKNLGDPKRIDLKDRF